MLSLSRLFQENCVLQQKKPCVIWGCGEPGNPVSVQIQGVCAEGKVNENGEWMITLPALTASKKEILKVTSGTETLTRSQVAIGEVWILGGQSNMEFWMRYDKEYKAELEKESFPNIRFFDFPEVSYPGAEQDFDYSRFGFWREADKENLEYFSAVGYYFASQLQQKLQVPIGLIGCNWGGTPACAWMDQASVIKNGEVWQKEYEAQLKEIEEKDSYKEAFRKSAFANKGNPFADKISDRLLYGMTKEEQDELMKAAETMNTSEQENLVQKMGPYHPNRPSGLYQTMLKQVSPFSASGVLWYQGESDSMHAGIYDSMLTGMIEDWRKLWKEELPFFLVQLAPFEQWMGCDGKNFPIVRDAQERVADLVPNVYLASIGDMGMRYDIHPKQKKPVGTRLSLLAEKYVYHLPVLADAPKLLQASRNQDEIIIQLNNTADGLYCQGDAKQEFELFDLTDGRKMDASEYELDVDRSLLRIRLQDAKDRQYRILYCMKDYYEANIYNSADLPLFPFRAEV